MRILICSLRFEPDNSIGAVRPTMFAHYLAKMGHEVTVLTIESFNSQTNFTRIAIEAKKNVSKKANNVSKKRSFYPSFIISIGYMIRKFFKEFIIYSKGIKIIKEKFPPYYFDIAISSYSPLASHMHGYYFKNKRIARYWICDLRDLLTAGNLTKYQYIVNNFFEQYTLKTSDIITVVSNDQKKMLIDRLKGNKSYNKELGDKIQVLYNGYSRFNSIVNEFKVEQSASKLIISYTGSLYTGSRDLSYIFKAISCLKNENMIDLKNISFLYAGNDFDILISQVEDNEIIPIIENQKSIPREEAITLQKISDILVVASWNNDRDQGILTGKFGEYLQSHKNILATISGNIPNSELKYIIDDLRLGYCFEEATLEKNFEELKLHLLNWYAEKIRNGYLEYHGNINKVEQFEYGNIVDSLNKICKKIMH